MPSYLRDHAVLEVSLDDQPRIFVLCLARTTDGKQSSYQRKRALCCSARSASVRLSLAAAARNVAVTSPHLTGYKLQHALTLAEYGFRDKALLYCEALTSAITAQTKRSSSPQCCG